MVQPGTRALCLERDKYAGTRGIKIGSKTTSSMNLELPQDRATVSQSLYPQEEGADMPPNVSRMVPETEREEMPGKAKVPKNAKAKAHPKRLIAVGYRNSLLGPTVRRKMTWTRVAETLWSGNRDRRKPEDPR